MSCRSSTCAASKTSSPHRFPGRWAREIHSSPDSGWIGFFADGKLKKVAVTGGRAITLAEASGNYGGTWGEDGSIVFARDVGELVRVSSEGGDPELLANVQAAGEGEVSRRWPQVLPGGKAILYTASTLGGGANLVVHALPSGPDKIVLSGDITGATFRAAISSTSRTERSSRSRSTSIDWR